MPDDLEISSSPPGNTIGRLTAPPPPPGARSLEASNPEVEAETEAEAGDRPKLESGFYTTIDGDEIWLDVTEEWVDEWGNTWGGHLVDEAGNGGYVLEQWEGGEYVRKLASGAIQPLYPELFVLEWTAAGRGAKLVEMGVKRVAGPTARWIGKSRLGRWVGARLGGRVARAALLRCGQLGRYADLKGDALGAGLERDHIPPKAALLERARELAQQRKIYWTDDLKNKVSRRVDYHGQSVAVPKDVHRNDSSTGNRSNRQGSRDLQGAARQQGARHRGAMSKLDQHEQCLKAIEEATEIIDNITNEQYDQFLEKLLDGAINNTRSGNPWQGILPGV